MKKTPSLYMRDYDGDRLVLDEVVEGSEWVLRGEGEATIKYDGTCCKVEGGRLFKRFDRKLTKQAARRRRSGHRGPWRTEDFKAAPADWSPCEPQPNLHTGHWPGWVEVGESKQDQWHREAFALADLEDGTYELVGPKIQSNTHGLHAHQLWRHGAEVVTDHPSRFEAWRDWFATRHIEGLVWHHPDGRKVKLKREDFGLSWP